MSRKPDRQHGLGPHQQEREQLLAALEALAPVVEMRVSRMPTTRGACEVVVEARRIARGESTDFGAGGRLSGVQQLERMRLLVRVLARYA